MRKYSGITFIGMILTMGVVIILGTLAMRVIPVYIEHYTITRALNNLSTISSKEMSSELVENDAIVKRTILKQLEIDNINYITEANITVEPSSENKMTVRIQYQVNRPFIANISLLFNFNDSLEVTLGR